MKVGDYVRTKQGYIRQIKEIYDHILYYVNLDKAITMERYGKFEPITQLDRDTIEEIIKSSSNIIDLIEVGDYVNGQRINFIHKDIYIDEEWVADKGLENEATCQILLEEDIKSIVTKEQFKSMEYEVK